MFFARWKLYGVYLINLHNQIDYTVLSSLFLYVFQEVVYPWGLLPFFRFPFDMLPVSHGNMLPVSHGDMLPVSHGDMLPVSHGNMLPVSHGDMLPVSHGDMLPVSHGEWSTMNGIKERIQEYRKIFPCIITLPWIILCK